jgi:hypothetical protein
MAPCQTRLFDTPCSIAEHSPFFSPFFICLGLAVRSLFQGRARAHNNDDDDKDQ